MQIKKKLEAGELTDATKATTFARDIASDLSAISTDLGAANVEAADIAAVAATAPTAVVTADGSDAGTTQTLANALKAQLNIHTTAINELRTLIGTVRTMANEIKAKYNAGATSASAVALKTTNA